MESTVDEDGTTVSTTRTQRVSKTDYLDKSLHGWVRISTLADRVVGASIGNDFTNGHRGMAKAVRGAKKLALSALRVGQHATDTDGGVG